MEFPTLFGFASPSFLDLWAERVLVASLQGGILLLIAWIVCLCSVLSAETRCWIWRLAYLKFILVFALGGLIELPVLNSDSAMGIEASPSTPVLETGGPINLPEWSTTATLTHETEINPPASSLFGQAVWVLWLSGCVAGVVIVVRQFIHARKLDNEGLTIDEPGIINVYRSLCAQLKISRAPRLGMTQKTSSPMIVGLFRSTILIPRAMLNEFDREDIRLILAHELGHAKRKDLMWNWLSVVVRTLFFFHPLIWLTRSKMTLDQEIACDQMTLKSTRTDLRSYGQLLVRCSASTTRGATRSLAAIGATSSFRTLKKRILEMNRFDQRPQSRSVFLTVAFSACCLLTLLPLQLVGQQTSNQENAKKANSQQQSRTVSSTRGTQASSQANQSTGQSHSQSNRRNVSISVSSDGVDESIKILWKNNRVSVNYSSNSSGSKRTKKYSLANIDELEQQNPAAYRFYKRHAASSPNTVSARVGNLPAGGVSQAIGQNAMRNLPKGFVASETQLLPNNYSREEPTSGSFNGASASSSSFSSAGGRSMGGSGGGFNRNNQSQSQSSSSVSGGNFNQLIQQVEKMLNETNDSGQRQSLQHMLEQLKRNNIQQNQRN